MNENDTKPGREEKAAARWQKKQQTLAEIQSALPAIYHFFMKKNVFMKEAQDFLRNNLEMMCSPEELWERYEYFVCSKLDAEKRQAFLNALDALTSELPADDLRQTRSRWMAAVFSQARSDEKRRMKDSPSNLYHRIQLLIKKHRPECLYFKGNRWYGRPGMKEDAVLLFEKNMEKDCERSFITSLPVVPGLELRHFYDNSGSKFRFEGFGRALDEILKSVQEKSGSPDAAFLLLHFMYWFTRRYGVLTRTVYDDDGEGSLSDRSQASAFVEDETLSPQDVYKVFLLLKEKLDAPHLRLLELKVYGKTARQIMEDMRNYRLRLNNDSAVNYHYAGIQKVADVCFAELGLPAGREAFKAFLAFCRRLYSIQQSMERP